MKQNKSDQKVSTFLTSKVRHDPGPSWASPLAGMEPTQWLPQIVHIIVRLCRLKKEKNTKRNENLFETRMDSDLSSSAVVKIG